MSSATQAISPLIVPINVEAWCASPVDVQAGGTRGASAANFSTLPGSFSDTQPYLSDTVLSPPFATDTTPPIAGVHLHWALPDALNRSTHRYQLSVKSLNQLRLLGLPLTEQIALAMYLSKVCPDDPTVATLAAQLQATPSVFSFEVWVPALATNSAAIAHFSSPEDFIGSNGGAADSMAMLLGTTSATRNQSILVQACGSAQFPAAPNRWLVIRTVTGDAGMTLAQWRARIIESDFVTATASDCFAKLDLPNTEPNIDPRLVNPKAYATSIPADPLTDGASCRFLGRASELAGWQEDASAARFSPLTAIGWGLPNFAASYVDCRTVFAHCDELGDLGPNWPAAEDQASLSYVVIGWHSDPSQDLLASATLDSLRWSVAGAQEGAPLPVRSYYAGMVYDVQWDPKASYTPGGADEGSTTVVVANNTAEALATLLGGDALVPGLGSITQTDLLEALQSGMLDQLTTDGASALPNLESNLHGNAFGAGQGGRTWGIVPQKASATETGVTLPATLAGTLDACNVAQQNWESQQALISSKRSRLFAAWHLYLALSVPPPSGRSTEEKQLNQDRLATLRKLLVVNSGDQPVTGALPSDLPDLLTASDQLASAVSVMLSGLDPSYKIVMSPGERFYRPTEPLVLLAGPGAQPSLRYGTNGLDRPDGMLRTRLLDNILAISGLGALVTSPSWPLNNTFAAGLGDFLSTANDLLCEALILDSAMAIPGPDRTDLIQEVAVDAVASTPAYATVPGFGQPPSRNAINQRGSCGTANPWHPIALHWQAQFRPQQLVGAVAGNYATDILFTKATMDPAGLDLEAIQRPDPSTPAEQYRGIALLSGRAQQTLAAQARSFLAEGDLPPALEQALQMWESRSMPVLTQALSGFNDALLMRTQQMQLRVWSPIETAIALPASVWIGSANRIAPKPQGAFNPLRFGVMNIDALRLVDCFGQIRDLDLVAQVPTIATSLKGPPPLPGDNGFPICFPPRLVQAARLRLRWRSAVDDSLESNDHPATSPICGWLLANQMDQSLMIYDATGTQCGALRVLTGDANASWLPSPGATAPTNPVNPHTGSFVTTCRAMSSVDFATLMASVQRTSLFIAPAGAQNHNPMSVLMGQPIALARLTFGLEIDGLPANDPTTAALDGVTSIDFAKIAVTAGLENITVPVRLGDVANTEDGLLGFFPADDYTAFVGVDTDTLLKTSLSKGAQTVSVLVDPRGSVHATSGVLPMQALRIPDDQYKQALEAMTYSFLSAPILGHGLASSVALPLPSQSTKSWHWLQATATGWSSQNPAVPDARAKLDVGPRMINEGYLAIKNLDSSNDI